MRVYVLCTHCAEHASQGPSRDTGVDRCACVRALAVCVHCRYSQAICRGLIQEGARGSKRCIGPRDMDLVSMRALACAAQPLLLAPQLAHVKGSKWPC